MTFPGLRAVSARVFVRALEKDGFVLKRTTGSHRVYRHPDGRRTVVAAHSPNETFAPGTLSAMIRHLGWNQDDLQRLGLLK